MGKISKICARVGKCFKKYFSIPLFTGMLLLGIQQSYFPAHAVETQTFNITYSGNKIQGESVWYQGHWSHNTSDLFWIEKVSTANNGDVTYRVYAGLRCHGYGSNHNAWAGTYQINLNGRTFNIGPNGKWWDRDIAGNGCWKNGGGDTFKTTLKAGQTYNISVYVKNPNGATASQWSGRISVPQVAYYQNIQARYQNADGTWGNYSSVKSGNANYNTTYSWSRAADGTYKAASISYKVTQANTKYVDVYRQVYTDYIDHWMWGFTKGEGNNGDKRAWKIKTTSFTKRAGQGYTLAAGDAVRVPNGFSLANTFGTASINGKWSSFNLGYSGSQPGGNMYIEFDYSPVSYKINYNMNGGTNASSNPSTYNVLYGVNFATPTRPGYNFLGWYINGTKVSGINVGANASFSSESDMYNKLGSRTTGDKTVEARWEKNSYTISIDPNGGSYNGSTGVTKINQAPGKFVEINQIPTRSGYTFIGWKRSGSGSLHSGHSYNQSGITQYEKADSDGTAYTNYKMDFDNTTNTGYAYPCIQYFSYGYTSGHTYQLSVDVRVNKSSNNEYAHIRHSAFVNNWVAPSTTVNYLTNGWEHRTIERTFTGTTSEQSGTNYNIYPFVEFYAGIAGGKRGVLDFDMKNLTIYDVTAGKYVTSNHNSIKNGATVDVGTGNTTITAVWAPNRYTVTYNPNKGSGSMSPDTVSYGTAYQTKKNSFTRTGYTFTGWNEKADGTGTAWTLTSSGVYEANKTWTWIYTHDITLYAQWKLDNYYIDYKVNDTCLTDRITDNLPDNNGALPGKDTAVLLTDFALQNGSKYNTKYTFKEWNTKPDGSGQKFTTSITNDGSLCKPGETLTLYAIWDATPAMSAKDFYLIENIAVQNDIVTTGAGYDKTPTEKYPEKLSEVKYPIKGLTKNGTDISNKIKVDYIEYDNKAVGSIDVSNIGKYIVHYSLTDGYNTKKFTRNITVLPASTPVINAGDRYFKKNAFISADILKDTVSANDKYDGDLIAKTEIKDVDKINVGEEGVYQITYSIKNSSNKTANKKVNIYIIDYLPDNSADVSNSFRFVRKDCSEANDYCLQYFNEDSKWTTDSNLKEFLMNSLSKTDDSKPVKKYSFKSDDVAKSKKK